MKQEVILTVAQSKRLIAQGVKSHPVVKTAFHNGTIGICRGTTCTYVAEEFLDRKVGSFTYTTGLTLPKKPTPPIQKTHNSVHDVIIRKGEIHMDGEQVTEAAINMQPGDVIIKGANALNYRDKIAGCLVGHPRGGTVGGFWGPLYGMRIRLVIPVGLEKEIGFDIREVSAVSMDRNPSVSLMPMTGIIITEIEAIELLTGAQAYQIAAGGVRGAEGAVRLLVDGTDDQMKALSVIMKDIAEEEPF